MIHAVAVATIVETVSNGVDHSSDDNVLTFRGIQIWIKSSKVRIEGGESWDEVGYWLSWDEVDDLLGGSDSDGALWWFRSSYNTVVDMIGTSEHSKL